MNKKHLIWTSLPDYEEWREDLEAEFPDASEEERYSFMCQINDEYLDDERANLDIQLNRPIIIIGDIGRWNGRVLGYKEIASGNIRDCLESGCDINTWYLDECDDLRCDASHHDGTNHYLYRTYKDGVSDTQIENFKQKIYEGKVKRPDITRITRSLGEDVRAVYGW